jgi:hypothetical protein
MEMLNLIRRHLADAEQSAARDDSDPDSYNAGHFGGAEYALRKLLREAEQLAPPEPFDDHGRPEGWDQLRRDAEAFRAKNARYPDWYIAHCPQATRDRFRAEGLGTWAGDSE